MEFSSRIKEVNLQLKSANIGVTIDCGGGKLSLRATLPPRQGNGQNKQQRIPLNISATLSGLKQAVSEAHAIRRDLDTKKFNWEKYLKIEPVKEAQTEKLIGDWVEAFEVNYFERRERNQKSLTTWYGDYLQVFKRLPSDKPLTDEILRRLILTTQPDTKSRKRYCTVLGALARFVKVDFDELQTLCGKYSPKRVSPRDIPIDADIASWFDKLNNPAWKWVYGILATYGLRNHEVFRLDFDRLRSGNPVLHVLQGKTGSRRVWACFPEWFETFNLSKVTLPRANLNRTNAQLGNNVTHYFARHEIPFSAYDLRHAWAIRTLKFGLDISLASQQMGHSLAVHSQTYHHWISDRHHQEAYDLLMLKSDRLKPPPA